MNRRWLLPILGYHSIDDSGSALSVAPVAFERQMQWLFRRGYQGMGLGQWMTRRREGTLPGRRACVITFDDGWRNNAETAAPILRKLGFGASLFLVTGAVGETATWQEAPPWPLISWDQAVDLMHQGIEIQAHGHDHHRLSTLPEDALNAQILASRDAIEQHTGQRPSCFCYPHGDQSPRVVEAVRHAGFACAVTTRLDVRHALGRPFELGRIMSRWFRRPPGMFAFMMRGCPLPGFAPFLRRYARVRRGVSRC